MKKVLVGILILLMGVVSAGVKEDYSVTYFMAGGGLEEEDIYITGIRSDGSSIDDAQIDEQDGYEYGTEEKVKLFQIRVSDAAKGAKIIIGYEDPEEEERYVILSTKDAAGDSKIERNYDLVEDEEDYLKIIDPLEYSYETFPGYEVEEGTLITGIRIGRERIDTEGREEPSNVVERFFKEVKVGEEVYIKAGVSPTNSKDEFKVVDINGKILIVMKKDEMKIGDNSYSLKTGKETLKKNDEIEVDDDGVYLNGSEVIAGEGPFEVVIRIKKKLTTSKTESIVKVDDVKIDFSDEKNYNLSRVSDFKLTYSGKGNGFDYEMDNEDVIIGEGGSTREGEEVYIIEGVGTKYEGGVAVEAGSTGGGKQRISDVQIKILDGENGINIRSIAE